MIDTFDAVRAHDCTAKPATSMVRSSFLTFLGIVAFMGFPSKGFEFRFAGNAERCTKRQMPFMAVSVRAVKAALSAFIGAERRALTEGADGSGVGFSQEGQAAERTVEEKVFHPG